MKQFFPIEASDYTIQDLYVKRTRKTQVVYLAVIATLLAFFICLPLVYVDVSSQCRGVVRTPTENNLLQSVLYGEVVKTCLYENMQVAAGDTLVWLRANELNEQIWRYKQRMLENTEFIQDLENLTSSKNTKLHTPKYIAEFAQYAANLEERMVLLAQAKKEYEVAELLLAKGVESRFEFEQVASRYQSELSQLNLLKQQHINIWQSEKTRLDLENRNINSEIAQLEQRKTQTYITAPISGNITQYAGVQVGNFVSPSQTIAHIVPNDSMIVECYVSPRDIGYIHEEQKVAIQVDAYDYRQWGLLEGKVIDIISDVTQINNQVFFRVRCSIEKDYFTLSNGYKGKLKKGMTLTGRFYLTRRSLAQLLFDRLDNWINPKILKNGDQN